MRAFRPSPLGVLCAVAQALAASAATAAPYVAGNRVFPATVTSEDPFVAGEASFGATHLRHDATDSDPVIRETGIQSELALRLTEDLGIGIEGEYVIQDPDGEPNRYGFDNVEARIKYQFYVNEAHELLLSAGVVHEFGGTGTSRIGAESVGSTTPTLYFGKGFGDLPEGMKYFRPFALTGLIGYQIADRRSHTVTEIDPDTGEASTSEEHSPNFLVFGGALEYSFRYLQGNVDYLGLPVFIGRLTPLVEFVYETPVTKSFGEKPTGLVAPGLIYSDIGYDVGVEALIPVTEATGAGLGVAAKLTVFLDRFVPPLVEGILTRH